MTDWYKVTSADLFRDSRQLREGTADLGKVSNDLRKAAWLILDRVGTWKAQIDTGTQMLECTVCEGRVVRSAYLRAVAVGAEHCPYCGSRLRGAIPEVLDEDGQR